ncbi:hypothetical protein [Amycolatopsis suaedae]|uniref:Uncharacterized protein n=1 Tax=Amycolatopsis suaedae TaxID=2510978 RepID=A0A4V2EMK8_9PSEU|nr:hypothetical protein [Amycolatopsis suaedae]RZQ65415.1 hypothetical protein EWH70_05995 [Amycolatopsis suaedae]
METWRIVATSLLGLAGLFAVLIVMAQVRDRTHSGSKVATSGAVAFTTLLLLCLLVLTVLPSGLSWGIVVAVTAVVGVLLLAS